MIVRLPVVSTFDCECGLMLSSCNCPFGIRQISKRAGTYPFLCSILGTVRPAFLTHSDIASSRSSPYMRHSSDNTDLPQNALPVPAAGF